MIIRLEHKGLILHEIRAAEIKGELVMGRGHSCDWVMPKEDGVASSRHAALFLKNGKPWVRDLGSTNGIYFQGKTIPQKKLEPGDRISVGDCLLAADVEVATGVREPSRLLAVNGPHKGRKFDLKPPAFAIGSDPTVSLVLLDMLVSKRHAEITVKEDGSCWIRDLGSKNGSAVNGMPLRGDQERLLKDSDKITIAQFDLLFHDGVVKHSNSQLWLRIGVIVATLVVALSGYWGWRMMRPDSEKLYQQAKAAAAHEDFATASTLLNAAGGAMGADSTAINRTELVNQLSLWKGTVQTWGNARRNLEQGQWVEASRNLSGALAPGGIAWSWSPAAAAAYEEAQRAKVMLDALTRATASLTRENADIAEIRVCDEQVRQALAQVSQNAPPYTAKLLASLQASQETLGSLLQENNRLDSVLENVGGENPPFREIIDNVGTVKKNATGQLRKRAELVFEPVVGLGKSQAALFKAATALRNLKYDEVLTVELNLPSIESCAVHPRLSQKRERLMNTFNSIQATAKQLSYLYDGMIKEIGRLEGVPPQLQYWRDDARVAQLLACDTLEKPLPKRSRTSPDGRFDEAVGTEEFYLYLSGLPESYATSLAGQDLPFPTMLTQTREAMDKIELFTRYLESPENAWLLDGRLARAFKDAQRLLAERDALVKRMIEKAETSGGRAAIIAGGIALRLAPVTDKPLTCQGTPLADWLPAAFKKERAKLIDLNSEYGRSAPSRQIEIRNEILRLGLPGDPVVRRLWAARDAANSAGAATP